MGNHVSNPSLRGKKYYMQNYRELVFQLQGKLENEQKEVVTLHLKIGDGHRFHPKDSLTGATLSAKPEGDQ